MLYQGLFIVIFSLATTVVTALKMSMFSSSSSKGNPHLHTTEYPGDDYSHIKGYGSEDTELSKLQIISAYRIADTVRNKIPLDTDGCGIDRSFYISSEDLL